MEHSLGCNLQPDSCQSQTNTREAKDQRMLEQQKPIPFHLGVTIVHLHQTNTQAKSHLTAKRIIPLANA